MDVHSHSVLAVAKKDFQDAVRSHLFWGLSSFFFMLLVAVAGLLWYVGDDVTAAGATTEGLIGLVFFVTRLVIPVIALIVGWKAIAGERESGSIKVLLSLPHSRTDMLLGKLLGRSAVLSVSLVVGFVVAGVLVAILLGGFDLADYLGLLVVSIIYGIAYTSIAVSLSALARSTGLAAGAAFGVFVLFYIVWNAFIVAMDMLSRRGVLFLDTVEYTIEINGEQFQAERLQGWVYFVDMLDPGNAYGNVLSMVVSVAEVDAEVQTVQEEMFGGSLPFYLQDWFALVVLLFWIVAPIAVAIYHFERVDL